MEERKLFGVSWRLHLHPPRYFHFETMSVRMISAARRTNQYTWRFLYPIPMLLVSPQRQGRNWSSRCYAESTVMHEPHGRRGQVLLTRDFIAQSLYDRDGGYFTKDVINSLPGPLDFRGMLGEWHYRMALKKVRVVLFDSCLAWTVRFNP